MKPSCRIVLNLLRDQEQVTTHDFLEAGAGSRFGARIGELRAMGYVIDEQRLPLPTRGSCYQLVAEPDVERVCVPEKVPAQAGMDAGSLSGCAGVGVERTVVTSEPAVGNGGALSLTLFGPEDLSSGGLWA